MNIENVAQELKSAQSAVESAARNLSGQITPEQREALQNAINAERQAVQELVHAVYDQHGIGALHYQARGSRGILDTLGHAMEWGAGFGIGEDIVRKIL